MSILTSMLGLDGLAGAAGTISTAISGVLQKIIPDADKRIEAEKEITLAVQQSMTAQMGAMQAVMVADAGSDNILTKSARPILVFWSLFMVSLIAVLGLFGVADPVVSALAKVPAELWNVMLYGVGIFAGGRSAEKVASTIATAVAVRKK